MARLSHVDEELLRHLDTLVQDYHDFNGSTVPLLPYPTAVQFSKQVNKGRPCVYQLPDTKAAEWPALSWTLEDVISKVEEPIDVAVTPSGNADSLIPHPRIPNELLFVEPATIQLKMKQLMSRLIPGRELSARTACYLQSQDSNLTTSSLSSLLPDLQPNFDFAIGVLGEPEALNIWIGDDKSATSIHRDPYENLYLVLKGQKMFRLWAPVDEVSMPTVSVPTGRYEYTEAESEHHFNVLEDGSGEKIPWVNFDPLSECRSQTNAEAGASTRNMHQVTVQEGQVLYLPAGWYHHVTQRCGKWQDGSSAPCIAINYWYDQEYEGDRYVLRQLVSRMVEATRARAQGSSADGETNGG